ncbi:hypothetical protein CGMCC3_g17532 [Colletotrichum fructicola]|nr:uncharacterized protein CGMCC3_g17532 [Colletotrichum fructicola]KAE9566301.1 hypothetical protein CGMCC3_g17532 [Colletotrichum fructicola]
MLPNGLDVVIMATGYDFVTGSLMDVNIPWHDDIQ